MPTRTIGGVSSAVIEMGSPGIMEVPSVNKWGVSNSVNIPAPAS